MATSWRPIEKPVQPIIGVLQDVLSKHGNATIEKDPEGYFTYMGAHNHAQESLRILKGLLDNNALTSEPSSMAEHLALISQLEILLAFEWST